MDMQQIIEYVPNFSEGWDMTIIEKIKAEIESVRVYDYFSPDEFPPKERSFVVGKIKTFSSATTCDESLPDFFKRYFYID